MASSNHVIEMLVRNIWPGANVAFCYELDGRRRIERFRWDAESKKHTPVPRFEPEEFRVLYPQHYHLSRQWK